MRFTFALLLLLALAAFPAFAQDSSHSVSFDGFSFSYDNALAQNVNIMQMPGTPMAEAGPGFSDAAHTAFNLYNQTFNPEPVLEDKGGVKVYRLDDVAQYDFLQEQVAWLEQLLDERPDLNEYLAAKDDSRMNYLPYVPVLPHGQIIAARAQYLETDAVKGITYIVYSNAALEPFLGSYFTYTFQGISSDGQYYLSAGFRVNASMFPAEPEPINPEEFQAQWPEYLAESIAALNAATPGDFSPSLDAFDAVIQSIRFES